MIAKVLATRLPLRSPGRRVTRRSRAFVGLAAVLGAVLLAQPTVAVASAAAGTETVAFTGHYTGTASLLINNSKVTISAIHGKGSGTLVGASTVVGNGSGSAAAQCDPFGGTGSISGAGAKIALTVTQSTTQGCSSGQSGPVTVTFKGVAKATGGTGKAKGAAGTLKFKGTLKLGNTSGSQNGPFSVTLTGRLTVKR